MQVISPMQMYKTVVICNLLFFLKIVFKECYTMQICIHDINTFMRSKHEYLGLGAFWHVFFHGQQGAFPGNLQLVLVLRPSRFFQRAIADIGIRLRRDDFKMKVPVSMLHQCSPKPTVYKASQSNYNYRIMRKEKWMWISLDGLWNALYAVGLADNDCHSHCRSGNESLFCKYEHVLVL